MQVSRPGALPQVEEFNSARSCWPTARSRPCKRIRQKQLPESEVFPKAAKWRREGRTYTADWILKLS